MLVTTIVELLDREFRVPETADPGMTKHALSEFGRSLVQPAFHERKTGLIFDFTASADQVFCVTFITQETVEQVLARATGPALLFTHHPFDYHEDERGLGPVPDDLVGKLKDRRIAAYAIHAPLDVGLNISVSRSLASRLDLSDQRPFSAALGGHLGVCGRMTCDRLESMAGAVGRRLNLDSVDMFDYGGPVGLTAVVAGGGDQVPILREAQSLGCTTYITGTAVHRWARMQGANRAFHEAARQARVNLIGATHYNTEKWAVQDVARFLAANGVPAVFLEDPVLSVYREGTFGLQ